MTNKNSAALMRFEKFNTLADIAKEMLDVVNSQHSENGKSVYLVEEI